MHSSPLAASDAQTGVSVRVNSPYLFLVCSIAALGGLLFGYDWVVIGGAKPFFEAYFHLTQPAEIGWANSCALLGCLLGSVASGISSDRFGRKRMLVAAALLFLVSSLLTAVAGTFTLFVLWRIVGGMAIGMASNVSPTYIAEISPAWWRGRLVALNQLTIVFGILIAQIVNWLLAKPVPANATAEFIRQSWNGQFGWRWMFAAVCVPSAIFLVSALFVPESPRWLAGKGLRSAADAIFTQIAGRDYAAAELRAIDSATSQTSSVAHTHSGAFQKALLIGITLAVLQQWSGINILFNYAEEVYRKAGFGVSDLMFNIVITGLINVLCTLIAFRFVDSTGRRRLMLIGCAAIGICHLALSLTFFLGSQGPLVLLLTLLAIGAYAMTLAPVTWILISEIFPNASRGVGVSLAVSALWIASFVLTFSFPLILESARPSGTFALYAVICLAGCWFVYRRVPETKGQSLEDIQRLLQQ